MTENQRVRQAYADGEKPLSKWTKAAIMDKIKEMNDRGEVSLDGLMDDIASLPLPVMKHWLLHKTSYQKTGNMRRHTWFYSIDKASLEHLTKDTIKYMSASDTGTGKQTNNTPLWCVCSFLEWEGPRRMRFAVRVTEKGYIKGEWFHRKDGSKKSIKGAGFIKVKDLPEPIAAN